MIGARLGSAKVAAIGLLLFAASGCGGDRQEQSGSTRQQEAGPASSAAPQEWGGILLSLVGQRTDDTIPTLSEVKRAFASCEFGTGSQAAAGKCDPQRTVGAAATAGLKDLGVQLAPEGDRVQSIRLIACCGEDLPEPFGKSSVIRAEKLCPTITLVASQSARVYRVSSPGKRDFVAASIVDSPGAGATVSHTILLAPSEEGAECEELTAVERRLDEQFGAPGQAGS